MIICLIIYLIIGFISAIFANDSGKLNIFQWMIVFIFWLPILILGLIGFDKYIDKWIFNEKY